MAGEIQIGGTTFATESGGTVTVSNVDSATNRTNLGLGSIATQNANAVALTGGSLTGTEIDLKSSGTTIYKSDGTTAVLSESGGVVTLNNGTIGSGVTFPAGHIVQIVESQTTFKTVTTSAFSDVTGLSAGITITSGNQIYFQCEFGILQIANDSEIVITDSANTTIFTLVSFNTTQNFNGTITTPLVTPSSTTVTYKVRAKISSGTLYIGNYSANTTPLLFRIYEVQQ